MKSSLLESDSSQISFQDPSVVQEIEEHPEWLPYYRKFSLLDWFAEEPPAPESCDNKYSIDFYIKWKFWFENNFILFKNMEENLMDEFDEEIDFVHENENPEDTRFDSIVEKLQDIVIERDFEELQNNFLSDNCTEFDFEEENKIEYMSIF